MRSRCIIFYRFNFYNISLAISIWQNDNYVYNLEDICFTELLDVFMSRGSYEYELKGFSDGKPISMGMDVSLIVNGRLSKTLKLLGSTFNFVIHHLKIRPQFDRKFSVV